MSQPSDFPSHYGYALPNLERSPTSTRPGYATTVGIPGSGRPGQRQLDSMSQQSSSMYSGDDRFNPFDSAPRPGYRAPSQAFGGDMAFNNSHAWGYNAGAATINGAIGESSRTRQHGRRAQLPSDWMMADQPAGAAQGIHQAPQLYQGQPMMNQQQAGLGGGVPGEQYGFGNAPFARGGASFQESKVDAGDLIPTAIVIKNIPFNVRREVLASLMIQLNLPQPYAFNYHFDNGVFRGLAFANFSNAEDTAIVIEKMNGMEVHGRKLRVEYKKMLPEHERERIEREKREKRGQLEEQHRTLHPQTSMHSLTNASGGNGGAAQRTSPLGDLDLNQPETLEFYTQLTLFRNDPAREIFIFPSTITPQQRRTIHILAHNMGLTHSSIGEGGNRQLQVSKQPKAGGGTPPGLHAPAQLAPGVSLDAHRKGLSRAATYDFAETRVGGPTSNVDRFGRVANPLLEVPGSPDGTNNINFLRAAKSFADLRFSSPSPSPSVGSYAQGNGMEGSNVARFGDYSNTVGGSSSLNTPSTPGGAIPAPSSVAGDGPSGLLVDRMGSMSLNGYDLGSSTQIRPREAPGAIGSQRPTGNRANAPERQPRNPEWETSAGFGGRGRANGHMARGSDSSDNATRTANGSGAFPMH